MSEKKCMNCLYLDGIFCVEPSKIEKSRLLEKVDRRGVCELFKENTGRFVSFPSDHCYPCVCSKDNGDDGYVTHYIVPNSTVAKLLEDQLTIELSVDYKCKKCGNIITVVENYRSRGDFTIEGATDMDGEEK